jgi:hypothetical protein
MQGAFRGFGIGWKHEWSEFAASMARVLGDAWEHADDPYYPEPLTALAYRFGVNYVIYAMTH